MKSDRPTPRSRPRPAADAGADPADLGPVRRQPTPAAPVEATPAQPAAEPAALPDDLPLADALRLMQSGGPTKQLGQRISEPVYDLLVRTAEATKTKQRTLIEYAIVKAFATEEGQRTWRAR